MKNTQPILTFTLDCDSAIALVKLCLWEKGFYAQHNFGLTSACASFTDLLCPHRPNQICNCQLATLQICGRNLPAFPLVFHSYDGYTEIFYLEEGTIPPDVLFAIHQVKLNR
jgi:hypothetical protein